MYVYGPVPSRRLGQSLGVSVIPPKTCTFSCVYCQLGRTNRLQARRESFFPRADILSETLHRLDATRPDFVTFCGDGEPTLCSDLGWLMKQVKARNSTPIAVITNGSLLYRKDVRQDLEPSDLVIASLDAGDERTFWAVNRPHGTLDFGRIVQGLSDFRRGFSGQLWVEIMLVRDVNDSRASVQKISAILRGIRPHRVHILTPIRPPAEPWVKQPGAAATVAAQRIVENSTSIKELESGEFGCAGSKSARQAITNICFRHPLRLEQALNIEKEFSEPGTVTAMLEAGDLIQVKYGEQRYLLPAGMTSGRSLSKGSE